MGPSSPVLAGFLFLAGSLFTDGGFKRTWVRLLKILFIQKSIRVHQILQRGGKTKSLGKYGFVHLHEHAKIDTSPNHRHSCHWQTASTFSPCWSPEQVCLLKWQMSPSVCITQLLQQTRRYNSLPPIAHLQLRATVLLSDNFSYFTKFEEHFKYFNSLFCRSNLVICLILFGIWQNYQCIN